MIYRSICRVMAACFLLLLRWRRGLMGVSQRQGLVTGGIYAVRVFNATFK